MKKLLIFCCVAALAAASISCEPAATPGTNNANSAANAANSNAAKPAAAAPTKESLVAMENKAFEAWSKKDGKFFEAFMTDNFVAMTPAGPANKTASLKEITGSNCEVKSYSFSDEQMTPIGADVAVLTYKAKADFTCDGKKQPSDVWAASVYTRSGDTWKAVYHNETPIADPNAKPGPPPPPAKKEDAATKSAEPGDALTNALLAVEKKGWEAWKVRDSKVLEDTLSKDFLAVSATGRTDKTATIKEWIESKCDVKSYSLNDAKSVSINANTAMLTFRGNAEGTCDGQPLSSLWGTTLMMKDGDAWRPVFYMTNM